MSALAIVRAAIADVWATYGKPAPVLALDTGLDNVARIMVAVVERCEVLIDGCVSTRLGDAWQARTVGVLVAAVARALVPTPCGRCGERLPAYGPCIYCLVS